MTPTFEWNGPPSLPEVRAARMRVTVTLDPLGDGRTRVELAHDRWQEGDQWRKAYDCFVGAWELVLGRLQARFADGPIDWSDQSAREAREERSDAGGRSLAPARFQQQEDGRPLAGRDPLVAAGHPRFDIRRFDEPRGRLRTGAIGQ